MLGGTLQEFNDTAGVCELSFSTLMPLLWQHAGVWSVKTCSKNCQRLSIHCNLAWGNSNKCECITIRNCRQNSVDAYLLEEQSSHISSQSSLKQQSLRLFWRQQDYRAGKCGNGNYRKPADVYCISYEMICLICSWKPAYEMQYTSVTQSAPTRRTTTRRRQVANMRSKVVVPIVVVVVGICEQHLSSRH